MQIKCSLSWKVDATTFVPQKKTLKIKKYVNISKKSSKMLILTNLVEKIIDNYNKM